MSTAKSAYPVSVAELLPKARELATRLGQMPSRNRLKADLKIGAPKANALLERLSHTPGSNPADSNRGVATESQTEPDSDPNPRATAETTTRQDTADTNPAPTRRSRSVSTPRAWPVLLLALPAFVAIWSGWVGLGGLTGFGIVHPLPGIADEFALNTAITLPIGMETYAAYALRVWVSPQVPHRARRFARASALGSLALGALGQIVYHLMAAAQVTTAPWPVTTAVACLPVAVLGMGAALTHLLHTPHEDQEAPA